MCVIVFFLFFIYCQDPCDIIVPISGERPKNFSEVVTKFPFYICTLFLYIVPNTNNIEACSSTSLALLLVNSSAYRKIPKVSRGTYFWKGLVFGGANHCKLHL